MLGKFITFESCEGGGKSTQIARLAKNFEDLKIPYIRTREPGGTPISEDIRNILQTNVYSEKMSNFTELFLFYAARSQVCKNLISPLLNDGKYVLSDRYYDSTTAYQGFGRNGNTDLILELNKLFPSPDLTILLDIDPAIGLERVFGRGEEKTRIEREELEFHKRVREGYHFIADKFPERVAVINAEQNQDLVAENIWDYVSKKFNLIPKKL